MKQPRLKAATLGEARDESLCEQTCVRAFSFTVTEYDPQRPWIVTSVEQRSVEDDAEFFAWARERWPAERFTVQIDPWQLSRGRGAP
jgi:hypothetical protein